MHLVELSGNKPVANGVDSAGIHSDHATAANGEVSSSQPGMVSEIKNLYQGKKDDDGKRSWVETYPDDLDAPAENAETARFALLIRNEKCYDGRRKLQIESIIMQSPLLRDALGSVLDDYPGITTGLERMTFTPPFEPFVHRWNKLKAAVEDTKDPETKAHLDLLYRILEEELKNEIKARDDLLAHNAITFDYVWMLFEPGTTVFVSRNGEPCAVLLESAKYGEDQCGRFYGLNCKHVDWDGEVFGYGTTDLKLRDFDGTKAITDLSAIPMTYLPNKEIVKEALIARGREFERLSGYHYKAYEGIAVGQGLRGPIKYNINSRIIIDTYAWNRFQPNDQVYVSTFIRASKTGPKARNDWDSDENDDEEDEYDYEDQEERVPQTDKVSELMDVHKKSKVLPLTRDQLLLCTTTLKGYALKEKKWLTLFIGNVKEIRWSEHAFDKLVLPDDHKELILALTESQRSNKAAFDDIIHGKGMGMIMLLSGPPGVGKTLTAESVAENMKVPLYMMSAGDLGTRTYEVEQNLSNILEMCTKWDGCILLIDEADVFLEQRSANNIERNQLVSIFLRDLEYYSGILFLTTNRVDNIDVAFQSRIHISMEYKPLSTSSRRHVWANFIAASTQAHSFSEEDLDRLAGFDMNGREIKNVLKTAQLLASRKGTTLRYEHVGTVLGIEKRYIGGAPK